MVYNLIKVRHISTINRCFILTTQGLRLDVTIMRKVRKYEQ